jgi:hypothetical protein
MLTDCRSVISICRLRVGGVARGWHVHVSALQFLHVHVIVWVLHEGTRSRGNFGGQIAGAVPLVADSAK